MVHAQMVFECRLPRILVAAEEAYKLKLTVISGLRLEVRESPWKAISGPNETWTRLINLLRVHRRETTGARGGSELCRRVGILKRLR